MQLIINDIPVETGTGYEQLSLLDHLRDVRGLTAAKPACGSGDCGACLVLLGEIPPGGTRPVWRSVNSCLLPLAHAEGCQVITPEGLNGPGLNPLQEALLEEGAVQCGYCTPGLLVAMTAALLQGVSPFDAAEGNLCRCTGYAGIRRALGRVDIRFGRQARTVDSLVSLGVIPPVVAAATARLQPLPEDSLFPLPPEGIVGGNTDLGVLFPHCAGPGERRQLHRIPALRQIERLDVAFRIGAAVTPVELQSHEELAREWPALCQAMSRFASPSIRQMATVGGNLVHASPVADLAVLLLALSAELELSSSRETRRLPLSRFFLDYHRTALQGHEVLTAILIPRNPDNRLRLHAEKVSRRERDDIATVNSALVEGEGLPGCFGPVTLSAGGVGPVPLRLDPVAGQLDGKPVSAATVRAALSRVGDSVQPVSDHQGSAGYKRRLLQHLLVSHLCALHPELVFAECLP